MIFEFERYFQDIDMKISSNIVKQVM